MIVFSSVWGTGRTLSSSLFLMTVLSPSPSRSRLMIVVSSAFTMVVIGAATSVAAMQVKISLRIKWLLLLRLVDNFEFFSLFRFPLSVRRNQMAASLFMTWLAHGRFEMKMLVALLVLGVAVGTVSSASAKGCIKGAI